jgi:NTE family protein
MTTALILTGGGSLGAVQVGMLRELMSAGFRPDFIVGVSAGALNGAFLAEDPAVAAVDRMAELWSRVTTRQILGLSWRSLLAFAGLRGHVADARGLRSVLERELAAREFGNLQIPLHVLSAELASGDGVVISQGALPDAILSSTAIPGVFPPVPIDGRMLVDGAVALESPIAVAIRLGATRLIVAPCGFPCAGAMVPAHALGRAMHAITLLGCRQLRQDYERYCATIEMCIVPPLCPLGQSPYDYSRAAELILRARESTQAWLGSGGLGRSEFPGPLLPHRH